MDCGQILVREILNREKNWAHVVFCADWISIVVVWRSERNLSLSFSFARSLALYPKILTLYLASGKQKLLYFPLVLLGFEIRYFRLTSDLICIIISLIIYHIGHTGWFIGSGEIWLRNWIVCKLSIENKSWHERQTFWMIVGAISVLDGTVNVEHIVYRKLEGFVVRISSLLLYLTKLEGKKNLVFLSFTRSFIHSLIRI